MPMALIDIEQVAIRVIRIGQVGNAAGVGLVIPKFSWFCSRVAKLRGKSNVPKMDKTRCYQQASCAPSGRLGRHKCERSGRYPVMQRDPHKWSTIHPIVQLKDLFLHIAQSCQTAEIRGLEICYSECREDRSNNLQRFNLIDRAIWLIGQFDW